MGWHHRKTNPQPDSGCGFVVTVRDKASRDNRRSALGGVRALVIFDIVRTLVEHLLSDETGVLA